MNRILKRTLSLMLVVALMLSMVALPSMGTTVQAAGIQAGLPAAQIVIGTGNNTSPTVIGFGGKQWVVIGYNGTGVNSEADTMTLLLKQGVDENDNCYGRTRFDTSGASNVYNNSTIQGAMNSATGTMRAGERALIIPVTLTGGSANQGQGGYLPNNVAGADVVSQLFWPLSVSEAESLNNNVRMFTVDWWLRSAGYGPDDAALVWGNGDVFSNGLSVDSHNGIRPAFKLGLTSVIFSSSNPGGKPTQVGADLSAATQPTAAQKLTVIDSGQTLNVIATTAEQSQTGSTLSFSYDGATTGTEQWVSCVLTDNLGAVKYYGKLADTTSADSGTLSIPLAGVADGTYTLRIFSEQANDDNYTDFASTPVDMTVNVTGETGTVSNFSGTAAVAPIITGGETATTDTIRLFENATDHTKNYTITGTPAPTVSVTNDDGTGASITNAGALTIPAGLTQGSYIIEIEASNGELPNATMTVTVNVAEASEVPCASLTAITLEEGKTGDVTVAMGTGTQKATSVSIVSDNPNIATVSLNTLAANGTFVITGVAEGNTNITITWFDGVGVHIYIDNIAVEVSKLPVTFYTITANTTTGGTVTGGGSYAENTTATVVAKAAAGHHFKRWTENGAVVNGAGATYRFPVTAPRTLTAEFELDSAPPSISSYTITLGASGNGTVSGGGDYGENTTATVVAKAAAGHHFKRWTENGAVINGAGATYRFPVTAPRTLIAEFEADIVPQTPPIVTTSGRSSGGGTSKPDASPVAGRPFTKPDATKLFNAALAAKPEGQATLSIKARNYTKVDKSVLAELAALAQKNGVTLTGILIG